MKKILSLILILFCFTTLTACGASDQDYVCEAVSNVKEYVSKKGYEDIVVRAEKSIFSKGTQFYNLILESNIDRVYPEVFEILNLVDKYSYFDAVVADFKIFFSKEYYVVDGEKISILGEDKLNYNYALKNNNYTIVYNTIAEKNGVNLTMDDKGVIYLELDGMLTYKNSNREYVYTRDYCYQHVSSKFNVDIHYIESDIYIYEVFEHINK